MQGRGSPLYAVQYAVNLSESLPFLATLAAGFLAVLQLFFQ
jgi:hypothetical protein